MNTLNNKSISNYWTETGPMYEMKDNINFNYNGIKMDFMKLVTGNKVKINLDGYGIENNLKKGYNSKFKIYKFKSK